MKPIYMLDADVIIRVLRGKSPSLVRRFQALQVDEAVLSVIVYGELMVGVEKSSAPRQVDRATRAVIGEFEVLPLTVAAAREYALLRASLESAGNVISPNDMWIAAHALAEGMTLVSANEDEFRRVPGLKFENWARE